MLRYKVVIWYSEEDKCYIADSPDLTYCTAHGDTPEAALREATIAQEMWLEVAKEKGMTLPDHTQALGV